MKKLYSDLPGWTRGVIVLFIILLIVLIIYISAKKIKAYNSAKVFNKTANEANDEYKKLKNSGQVLTNREIDYNQLANTIVINLSGCDSLAAELKVIDDITKVVKKPIDWYHLVDVFDVKDIPDCGWGKTTYSLPELLKDQLDTGGVYEGIGGGIGSGVTTESINLLTEYLHKIGVTL